MREYTRDEELKAKDNRIAELEKEVLARRILMQDMDKLIGLLNLKEGGIIDGIFEERLQEFIWKEICHQGLEYPYGGTSWENFMKILREAKNLHYAAIRSGKK